jgi:hypothetical protein
MLGNGANNAYGETAVTLDARRTKAMHKQALKSLRECSGNVQRQEHDAFSVAFLPCNELSGEHTLRDAIMQSG